MTAEDEARRQAVLDGLNLALTGLHSANALLVQQNVELTKRVGDLEAENAVLRAAAKERD